MKVTSIKSQVKRAGWFSIFVDEKYSFSLSDSSLISSGLRLGQDLTKNDLKKFRELSTSDKIYAKTLNYLSIRARSKWEIETYLKRHKTDDKKANEIIQRVVKLGLIDDSKFAHNWAESRINFKPTSKRKIRQELRLKRINPDTINEILDGLEINDQHAIDHVINQKRKQPKYQDDQKLMQYLARQGFIYDDIKNALRPKD